MILVLSPVLLVVLHPQRLIGMGVAVLLERFLNSLLTCYWHATLGVQPDIRVWCNDMPLVCPFLSPFPPARWVTSIKA